MLIWSAKIRMQNRSIHLPLTMAKHQKMLYYQIPKVYSVKKR
jgi:hypothetical protein